jgi:hypothetical protein
MHNNPVYNARDTNARLHYNPLYITHDTAAPMQMTKNNAKWMAIWRTKDGPESIARHVALQQLKDPVYKYKPLSGELGNFHMPGNTPKTRNARINSQKARIYRELTALHGWWHVTALQAWCETLARKEINSRVINKSLSAPVRACVNAIKLKLKAERNGANRIKSRTEEKKRARKPTLRVSSAPKRPNWRF